MKKILYLISLFILTLALAMGTIPMSSPAQSAGGGYLQPAIYAQESLPVGTYRVTPYVTETVLGSTFTSSTVSTSISGLPATMPDLTTKIVCEWRAGIDIDGVPYLVTGNNLYSSRVTGTRVSVYYSGKSCVWDPVISLGGKNMSLDEGPYLIEDPLNPNYDKNTVVWSYTCRVGGWLGIGARTVTVTRYLRQIEGTLLEYYVLDSDPGGDIQIHLNYDQDTGFIGIQPVSAWDYNHNPIKISGTPYGKEVLYSDLSGVKYPITIDPTTTFITSSSDGYLIHQASTWSGVHDAASSGWIYTSSDELDVRTGWSNPYYYTARAYVYFDTSSIEEGSTVTSATLGLYPRPPYGPMLYPIVNPYGESLIVQSGMPTYPHNPLLQGDFYYGQYSSSVGSIPLSSIVLNQYNYISITPGCVYEAGTTKLMLWDTADSINRNESDTTYAMFCSYEYGVGYQPKLTVTYTLPITVPIVSTTSSSGITSSSALLTGYLADSGGASCNVRFRWGLTTGYGQTTSWQSGYSTGQSFSDTVNSFSSGTLYHFAAEGSNSAGSYIGNDLTLLTRPLYPTNVVVTPGDGQNSLSWTIGTGSSETLIRRKTTGYPTSTSDGTLVYQGIGGSGIDTPATNGVTYYYSFWGYKSEGGLSQYSQTYSTGVGTPVLLGPPSITTYNATDVTQHTATLKGYLTSLQGASSVDCWFQYYTGGGTWTDYETSPVTYTSTQQVNTDISGLSVNTSYHCRIVGNSSGGLTNGPDVMFATGCISAPSMLTQSATGVSKTSAQLNGLLSNDGGEVCTVWFEYGKTTSYGFSSTSAGGQYTGYPIYLSLSGLDSGTPYHYRLVGQNSGGIGYGNDISFNTTLPDVPTCYTGYASSIGSSTATLQGSVTSDGGTTCNVRFLWGDSESYGNTTGWQEGFSSSQSFSAIISGLSYGVTYHYAAQITNTGGSSSGSDVSFNTTFGSPENFRAISSNPTTIVLTWTPTGDQTGVWMDTSSFPSDRFSSTEVYFGSSSSTSVGDLEPGTTYFFRAWSWLDSGDWSPSYSEDVVTTSGQSSSVSVGIPNISVDLTEPSEYFQAPNGSGFSDWPGYALVEDAATGSGIPSGSLWLIIATVFSSVGGILAWRVTGSLPFVIVTIGVVIAVSAIAHLVSLWILFAFIVMGGALAMILKHQAG